MNPEHREDPLSSILHGVKFRPTKDARVSLRSPWAVRLPLFDQGFTFVMVGRGSCFLEFRASHSPTMLSMGDVALISTGAELRLSDGTCQSFRDLFDLVPSQSSRCPSTQGDHPTAGEAWIALTHIEISGPTAPAVIAALGLGTSIRSDDPLNASWLQSMFQLMSHEAGGTLPGAEFARSRLLELYCLHILRATLQKHLREGKKCAHSLLRALFDEQLSHVVELIHERPEHPWTVSELASAASMSRTAFAVRFSEVAGTSPLAYVTGWRMMKASELILEGRPIRDVADSVGYDSDAAFARAFKRQFGASPGSYRKQASQAHT